MTSGDPDGYAAGEMFGFSVKTCACCCEGAHGAVAAVVLLKDDRKS